MACDPGQSMGPHDAGPRPTFVEEDALPHEETPDGSMPAPIRCDERLLHGGRLSLYLCADSSRIAIAWDDELILERAYAAIDLDDAHLTTPEWPRSTWRRPDDRQLIARFSDLPRRPDLEWRFALEGASLIVTLSVIATEGMNPVRIAAVWPIRVEAAPSTGQGAAPPSERSSPYDPRDGVFTLDRSETWPAWRVWADPLDGLVPPSGVSDRPNEQLIWGPHRSVLVGGGHPHSGRVAIEIESREARPESLGRFAVRSLEPSVVLSGQGRHESPSVAIQIGEDPLELLDQRGQQLANRLPADMSTESAVPWGWRSGGAYGVLINESVLASETQAMAQHMGDHWPGHEAPPWIVADGRWYVSLGIWEPGPGLPNGLRHTADLVASHGGRLALGWPMFSLVADAPSYAEHPEWALTDTDGQPIPCRAEVPETACVLVDPSIPAVRDALAREADTLHRAGIEMLSISDPLPSERLSAAPLSALARALRRVSRGGVLTVPQPWSWPTLGVVDAVHLGHWAHTDVGARCFLPPRNLPPGGIDPCDAELTELVPGDARPSPSPERLSNRARALGLRWHLSGLAAIDAGPIYVGPPRSIGEARQAAVIAALTGGPYWLGDSAVSLDAARAEIFFAPLRAKLNQGGAARPLDLLTPRIHPPAIWLKSGRALAVFNWTDQPRRFETLPPDAERFEVAALLWPMDPTPRDPGDPDEPNDPDSERPDAEPLLASDLLPRLEVPAHDVVVLLTRGP